MASLTSTKPPTTEIVPGTATTAKTYPSTLFSQPTHPLDPLTADEIAAMSLSVREYIAKDTPIKAVKFVTSALIPPPKKTVLAILSIPFTPGAKVEPTSEWVRRAQVDLIDIVTGNAYNATATYTSGKWTVDTFEKVEGSSQPQITVEELVGAELAVQNDLRVQALAKEVGVLPHQIRADGWSIGYDERFPESQRVQQALLFARYSEHDNLYAHPLDFVPVLDSNTMKVIHIDFPPHRNAANKLSANTTAPPILSDAPSRERIPPPLEAFDFLPDLMEAKGDGFKTRDDVKPLHVVQPEGVSFKVNGNVLEWQKWSMHIAFNHREGLAISTVTYNDNGQVRPLFYRLSLAEMVVPYGAPEFPHSRKFAFDAGEYGMGTQANDLTLGCDCLGQIHYLPGAFVGHDGSAIIVKQAICIHEEDDGLLWKHTDFRPGGRGQVVRSRRLVVSMCCTVANYEYLFYYYFYQDGTVEFETRLSGILQVYVQNPGEPSPYGTTVAPHINAHYHQHIFSLRVDPMIDGLQNSVVESDVVPIPNAPTGSSNNYAGNGFIVQEKTLKVAKEGGRSYDLERDRRWRIVNPNAPRHYASGASPGYGIGMKGGAINLLAQEGSWVAKRASFTEKTLWVVKDEEGPKGGRTWPSGKYVPQTRDLPEDCVSNWAKGEHSIENEDLVIFLTYGITHIPRPEDWPVMPVEKLSVSFRPISFFSMNPAMDVPAANDTKSGYALNGNTNGTHANDASCCSD